MTIRTGEDELRGFMPADIPDGFCAYVIADSDRHDLELALRLAAWRDGWNACLDHLAAQIGGRITPPHPSVLEILRYGPGGRAHAGDPRPGDHPGGPVPPW
jgi:hypothetical protein